MTRALTRRPACWHLSRRRARGSTSCARQAAADTAVTLGAIPVAVRVLPGNAGDPAAFTQITEAVRTKFHLARMVMAGDHGMITSARI